MLSIVIYLPNKTRCSRLSQYRQRTHASPNMCMRTLTLRCTTRDGELVSNNARVVGAGFLVVLALTHECHRFGGRVANPPPPLCRRLRTKPQWAAFVRTNCLVRALSSHLVLSVICDVHQLLCEQPRVEGVAYGSHAHNGVPSLHVPVCVPRHGPHHVAQRYTCTRSQASNPLTMSGGLVGSGLRHSFEESPWCVPRRTFAYLDAAKSGCVRYIKTSKIIDRIRVGIIDRDNVQLVGCRLDTRFARD